MREVKCVVCGKSFWAKCNYAKTCSKECHAVHRRTYNTAKKREYYRAKTEKPKMKNTLDTLIADLTEQGIDYATWKRQQALSKVTPIILEVK